MSVRLARRPITVDEYYRMAEAGILTENDRVELIHGDIIERHPIGSKHAAVVNKISNILMEAIGDSAIVRVQSPVKINDLNEPEPDVTILKFKEDFYAEKHPGAEDILVVIEISDTTLSYDKEIKLPLYALGGIPEFWLVDIHKNELEIHRNPDRDVYKKIEIIRKGDKIVLDKLDLVIDADLLLL